MIQPPGTETAQVEEELPDVFTFHLALSRSATYYRWREVGRMEQLTSDEDIACFLLHCYEKGKRERQPEGGVCTSCQSPLTLHCVHCSVERTQPMSALPPLYANYSHTHNLQKDVTQMHNQYYTGVGVDLNPRPPVFNQACSRRHSTLTTLPASNGNRGT